MQSVEKCGLKSRQSPEVMVVYDKVFYFSLCNGYLKDDFKKGNWMI